MYCTTHHFLEYMNIEFGMQEEIGIMSINNGFKEREKGGSFISVDSAVKAREEREGDTLVESRVESDMKEATILPLQPVEVKNVTSNCINNINRGDESIVTKIFDNSSSMSGSLTYDVDKSHTKHGNNVTEVQKIEGKGPAIGTKRLYSEMSEEEEKSILSSFSFCSTTLQTVPTENVANEAQIKPNISEIDPILQDAWSASIGCRTYVYHDRKYTFQEGSYRGGGPIILWLQHTFRIHDNLPLWLAVNLSKRMNLPIVALIFVPSVVKEATEIIQSIELGPILFSTSALCYFKHSLDKMNIPTLGFYGKYHFIFLFNFQ
jgi:hypothetical protein